MNDGFDSRMLDKGFTAPWNHRCAGREKSQDRRLLCVKERSNYQFLFRGEKNPKHG
jgi:hypothetical protein